MEHNRTEKNTIMVPLEKRNSNGRITIRIKKKNLKWVIFICGIIVLLLSFTYTQTRKITGTWIRMNDDNGLVGMVVHVSGQEGIITSVPEGRNIGLDFKPNQIKWRNIKRIGWGEYAFYDLVSSETGNNTYYDGTSTMKVSLDGKKMTLIVDYTSNGDNRSGLYQEWEKQ